MCYNAIIDCILDSEEVKELSRINILKLEEQEKILTSWQVEAWDSIRKSY
jgi:hypothetical protein